MKRYVTFYIIMVCMITFNCFAQRVDRFTVKSRATASALYYAILAKKYDTIVSYQVKEKITMKFGGSITTYKVSHLSLVRTNDLGPNNSRVVTPVFGKAKVYAVNAQNSEQLKLATDSITTSVQPLKKIIVVHKDKEKYIMIDFLSSYERILDKGFKSVEMLKCVGNSRYFEGDLILAAKWYGQLFDLTTDLDIEYYYRYSLSLTAIGQDEKANAMMKIFNDRN